MKAASLDSMQMMSMGEFETGKRKDWSGPGSSGMSPRGEGDREGEVVVAVGAR